MNCNLDTLADAYLRQHTTKSDDDFWACEQVDTIIRAGDLQAAWGITRLLLNKTESDETLWYVAAGPLEDFVDGYGHRALDVLEQSCQSAVRLQFALSGIWLLPESPVLNRWQDLMTKYGFRNGSREPLSYHPDCW